ncbi:uncharacterized protein K460DRAFT_332430 [Cucurbitaria berberidis CBS 394.84]|uniref:U3 snoRNA associated-domain-containing protein n=1 Tax=Cucurbitaria berberidis CBS 394.84 TaxID=1168544 RepID=A0A9P4L9P3_9PLEO|nr:uncharacterized protein K460DRAFT_332430 [Cucurbitaria berberidis CBS 394.84]KAF1847446.1 hypothetical protein K460DRAFT_332430 [Cucurbitaria berberidis CBS 394.84]
MFARVFDTAKRILSRSPSVPRPSSEAQDSDTSATDPNITMVTTRGGTETPGASTPQSSGRKRIGKRELEALETPTQVKRQRKSGLTPKKKVIAETPPEPDTPEEESSDTIAVAIPSRDSAKKADDLQIRRHTSPKVVVAMSVPPASTGPESPQQAGLHTPKKQSASVCTTPASTRKSSGRKKQVQTEDGPNTLEVTQTTSRLLKEAPSSTYKSEQAPISPLQDATAPASSQSKKAHLRFGSEEPSKTHDAVVNNDEEQKHHEALKLPQQPVATEVDQADDDASDSDEAPEIVTAVAATTKAKAAQAEADRALRAQQLASQAKRQKREDRIAEEQSQKRIREEKKAKKLARQLAKEQRATAPDDDEDEALSTRPDVLRNIKTIPALLPDSLLETIDDQRPLTPPPQRRGKTEEELRKEKLNHHIKFLERGEMPAKDVKKGKLSVAVLGQQNRLLPPKASQVTRNVREHWLKGRKVEKKKKGGKANIKNGKMERRAHGGGGFMRGGDD